MHQNAAERHKAAWSYAAHEKLGKEAEGAAKDAKPFNESKVKRDDEGKFAIHKETKAGFEGQGWKHHKTDEHGSEVMRHPKTKHLAVLTHHGPYGERKPSKELPKGNWLYPEGRPADPGDPGTPAGTKVQFQSHNFEEHGKFKPGEEEEHRVHTPEHLKKVLELARKHYEK
jgi:hypothetical protein